MATYTNNSGVLDCTGTDITSAGIYAALVAESIGTGHVEETGSGTDVYVFNAHIRIGSSLLDGSDSIWDCSNEFVVINAARFEVYGLVRMGSQDGSSKSQNGGSFRYEGSFSDDWRIHLNGECNFYGSVVKTNIRIGFRGNDSAFRAIDCDTELDDGIEGSSSYTGTTVDLTDSRVHHTSAVGVKAGNIENLTLTRTRIESCSWAIQTADPESTIDVFKDLKVDSCTNHLIPNIGTASNVMFINPDFTTLRVTGHDSSDITQIAFRYDVTVVNSSGTAIQNAKCRYVDEDSDTIIDNATTDSSGKITSSIPTYDSETVLVNSSYAGSTKTDRAAFTKSFISYSHDVKSESLTVDKDLTDTIILLDDDLITESTMATVDAYTEIETSAKFYDRAKSYLYANYAGETAPLVTRSGTEIDAGAYDITIDATAGSAFAVSGNTITIKATTFTGDIKTTGTVTLSNGASVNGFVSDSNGDSALIFSGVDSWTVYGSAANRDSNTSSLGTGTTGSFQFTYSSGTTYYLRLVSGTSTIFQDVTPTAAGKTEVSIATAALLTSINNSLSFVPAIVFVDTSASTNGDGSSSNPYDNIDDGITRAKAIGATQINVTCPTGATPTQSCAGLRFVSNAGANVLNLNGQDFSGAKIENLNVQGAMTGTNCVMFNCAITSTGVTGFHGLMNRCLFLGNCGFATGASALTDCFSGSASPVLTFEAAGTVVSIRSWDGTLQIASQTGGDSSIDIDCGLVTLAASCTGGTMGIRGNAIVTDNSAGTTVTDNTTTPNIWNEDLTNHTTANSASENLKDAMNFAKQAKNAPFAA